VSCLSDKYLAVPVSVLRNWVMTLIECEGQSPWRLHWPEPRDDDRIMSDWLTALSLRYTTFEPIEAAKMHVLEFHKGYLHVTPPAFPQADWTLTKIKRLIAQENPDGRRRRRPGLLLKHVQDICGNLLLRCMDEGLPQTQRQFHVNCGAAIAATYSPALRIGETCPGDGWDPTNYWSRQTIAAMLDAETLDRVEVQSVVIEAMKRKTVYMSAVALERRACRWYMTPKPVMRQPLPSGARSCRK